MTEADLLRLIAEWWDVRVPTIRAWPVYGHKHTRFMLWEPAREH
jgi:hypothetical protein